MNIILFGPDQGEIKQLLEISILKQWPGHHVRQINSDQHLFKIFCRPLNKMDVLVSFIATVEDTDILHKLKPFLNNTRLILVLHCRSMELLKSALKLTPSFVSYLDNDLMDIVSVLKKIQKNLLLEKK